MRILITGGAGFIGSNLAAALIQHPKVSLIRVIDNLSTGSLENIREFTNNPRFEFFEGDIRNYNECLLACVNIDIISHQAALGSVPRSIKEPLITNDVNVSGTLNIFTAAKEKGIKRIVYAASSSVYGDQCDLPKVEDRIGNPLSPYAVTKVVNELYAKVYASVYGINFIGLRYFNIFGPKQDPYGPYAAVIPLFIRAFLNQESPVINGDGSHSRDFTYIDNAVHANILALFTEKKEALNQVYNIACGEQTTLLQLFEYIKAEAQSELKPIHGPERKGDIKHSLADITKAKKLLGYEVKVNVKEGLRRTFEWYKQKK